MIVGVACDQITKRFGKHMALDRVSWRLTGGTVAGLLGASGAGKTTLLRLIAGLDRCDQGNVALIDERGTRVRERVSMVFQNVGLWPHLTALGHLECVLANHGIGRAGRRKKAEELLAEVQLPSRTWNQRPARLSGGEGQRLALARSLASQPAVLLLDEPLVQLDPLIRADLLQVIKRVAWERSLTVIYVTHSWDEIAETCQQAAVLVNGHIEQTAAVDDIYYQPKSRAIAQLTGPVSELPRRLLDEGFIVRQSSLCPLSRELLVHGDLIVVRPQQLKIILPGGRNQWSVNACRVHGSGWRVTLANGEYEVNLSGANWVACGETVGVALLMS